MSDPPDVAALVLAAGKGRRLRPLTGLVPKALCPVGNVPLLDLALGRLDRLRLAGPDRVAVNAWYLAEQVVAAVGGRAYLSVEPGTHPLGTAGAVGYLRDWVTGRGLLVANADAYLAGGDLGALLDGWDGHRTRLLGVPVGTDRVAEFGRYRFAGASLLPWHRVARLHPVDEPTDLVREVWRPAEAAGELVVIEYGGMYLDTGTPRSYLAANLHAAGSARGGSLVAPGAVVTGVVTRSVVGAGAVVAGSVTRAVVWPGGAVTPGEHLVDAVRYGDAGTVSMG
jgi:N-acetyl-alpha-D-muramate 1-phosphate uridylyltransferase